MEPRVLRMLADDWPEAAVVRTFNVASPSAGADWTATVPGESVWAVFSVAATLVTSAAVANRVPTLRITDGSATLFRVGSPVAITATLTTLVTWVPELGYSATALAGNTLTLGLPPLYLAAGQQVAVTTTAIDAADQWSAINLSVLEMYHGHRETERSIADRIDDHFEAIAGIVEGTL